MGVLHLSKSGWVLDILLLLMLILGSVNVAIFRHLDLNATMISAGEDLYYLAWITTGGFVINNAILLLSSLLGDGDSTRRSWMAIGSSIVAGTLYFTFAVGSSVHLRDLDLLKYILNYYSYNSYKFLLADSYVLAFLFWIDAGLRVMLRLRSGSAKKK